MGNQQRQPLLVNSSANTPIARQQIHNMQQWSNWEAVFSMQSMQYLHDATIEELLEEVFSVWPVPSFYSNTGLEFS
jgi:hypothetical protein